VQLPYVHIELVEGILVKDVDATISVHEDLRHPRVLNDRSYHQRELAYLNHPVQMISSIVGNWSF
jgi:hypothetical protein